MSKFLSVLFLCLSPFLTLSVAGAQTSSPLPSCSQMGIGQGASLNGFVPFPETDPFNENIARLPVAANSSAIIAALGSTALHPDFGAGTYAGVAIGFPYEVVGAQGLVPITYNAYGSQSDPGPMPIPANAPVEGAGATGYSDHHVFVLSQSNCFLYELFQAKLQTDGSWTANSGAVWDLLADNARPYTWTSADAAGLPIFPGLARYDEYAEGAIHHALRFTLAHTQDSFIAPATHQASSSSSASYAPMGARFRLKASYDISGFTPQARVILQALKTYGMIVADNGSNMFLSGTNDSRWSNDDLHNLGKVPASAFEVVSTGPAWTDSTAPHGQAPFIESFSATVVAAISTPIARTLPGASPVIHTVSIGRPVPITSGTVVAPGTAVTLYWTTTGVSYFVLTPGVGALRGNSVVVKPTTTTTYTLYANSHYGSTTKTFTVTVN